MIEQVLPPANWYADPEGSGRWRYWDGSGWTGVYLNQTEPGPSFWEQYWKIVRPWVFALGVVGLALSVATDSGWFVVASTSTVMAMSPWKQERRPAYGWIFFAAITIGLTINGGWAIGAGAAGCVLVMALVGKAHSQLPKAVSWALIATALVAFGALWFAGTTMWRG